MNLTSKHSSDQVRVIAIESKTAYTQQNLCPGRIYLANLIRAVSARHPRAIVIDKFFNPDVCKSANGSKGKETIGLIDSVQNAGVPVIVGESTLMNEDAKDENCLEQEPQVDFGAANVYSGILRLNANKEQIPVGWKVLTEKNRSTFKPSLSLRAAMLVEPQKACDLQSLQKRARQPYARMGPQPPSINAKLPCGIEDSRPCLPVNLDLYDKVVVIGAQDDKDHWRLFKEERPYGFQLQALYLDALLSGNYLYAVPGYLPVLLFFGFLIVLEGLPIVTERLQAKPLSLRSHTLFISIFSAGFSFAIILAFTYERYLPPFLMLSAVIVAWATRFVIAGLEHAKELIEEKK